MVAKLPISAIGEISKRATTKRKISLDHHRLQGDRYSVVVNIQGDPKQILVAHNQFFAVKLSDRWSKQQRTSNPYIVEIADCDDVEVYIEALSLMYCKDLRKKLMKEDVTRVLGILKLLKVRVKVQAKEVMQFLKIDSQMKSGSRQDSFEAEASQNGGTMHGSQNGGPNTPPMMVNQTMPIMPVAAAGAPGVPGPTTNLNIGMDYWGAATSSTLPALRGKAPPTPVAGGMVTAGSRDSVQSQLWLQYG
ncbi:unnamed protein product [Camellia sinensis]